jgi:hypothetical protein
MVGLTVFTTILFLGAAFMAYALTKSTRSGSGIRLVARSEKNILALGTMKLEVLR